jgi:hypothetical protein
MAYQLATLQVNHPMPWVVQREDARPVAVRWSVLEKMSAWELLRRDCGVGLAWGTMEYHFLEIHMG